MNLLKRIACYRLGRLALLLGYLTFAQLIFFFYVLPMVNAHAAEPKPVWRLTTTSLPTVFPAGITGNGAGPVYFLVATNIGAAPTSGSDPIVLKATLPKGLTPTGISPTGEDPESAPASCSISLQTVSCETTGPLHPGRWLGAQVIVDVAPDAEGTLSTQVSVEGGGATTAANTAETQIGTKAPDFGFLSDPLGFDALFTEADGSATTAAGSHPYQLTVDLGFPVEKVASEFLTSAGHLRNVRTDLPRGVIVDPAATPVLCTEAQLSVSSGSLAGCPDASQIGTASAMTFAATPTFGTEALYNMVPPPGVPGEVAFNADGVGIFIHLNGSLRSDSDYGISVDTDDILAFPGNPVLRAQVGGWGDPSGESHDQIRSIKCNNEGIKNGPCSVEAQKTALMGMPSACSGPLVTTATATSWEAPGEEVKRSVSSHDLNGNPVGVAGCGELDFGPKIEAKPTTNLADSPSGLDFSLHQPQNTELTGRSTSALKDATVTLPEGLVVNPSAAAGQGACDIAQIGLTTAVGQSPVHFSKAPASCPDASKLGTVEAISPLLAQIDPTTNKVLQDPETGDPIPRGLKGAVYLAKPFQNPFGSLIAIYISIDDPQSGTVAKFAAEVQPDPLTGQLRSTLTEGPELPLEDFRLHFFNGPRAALRTPSACATYTTNADLVPWSAPQGPNAHPADSFAISAAPGGGGCPASAPSAPNQPSFSAGTIFAQAGAFSPFVMRVSREDGSQPLAGFETTLPPGLSAKLAGIPYCSEADIARAKARSNPNEGALERVSPSCPAASEVGSVNVSAGAGPTPLQVTGHLYLAGPYKGAPLSFVIITPAVAGPFDLGVVAVRAAIYLDPETAQAHAVSDPLPTILDGISLDLRSAVVRADHPQFTLNPTNCEPKTVLAIATSLFGQNAALSAPFGVGGCSALAFKPKLSIKLKGQTKRTGHPALTATLRGVPGQANLKRIAVTLPRSEFLDQAHIGTVCTRVQFAANQCPAASIYGFAKATTPLLDQPLQGPVYLRSSSHELPDLVIALRGQVDIVLDGRVDSVNGGIRTTFEASPDAPVTKAVLQMQGGKKGLLINSANLCKLSPAETRATVKMDGQNGRLHDFNPVVKSSCPKAHKKKKGQQRGKRG